MKVAGTIFSSCFPRCLQKRGKRKKKRQKQKAGYLSAVAPKTVTKSDATLFSAVNGCL